MLNLQTQVDIPDPGFQIDYSQQIIMFGSCFSENIGNFLYKGKFKVDVNPFGILYNPASIAKNINLLFEKDSFTDEDIHLYNENWFSYLHHGKFSSPDKAVCLNQINKRFHLAKENIAKANVVFITLGTAWVYKLKHSGDIVANCHKIPASEFLREQLTVRGIVKDLSGLINRITKDNQTKFIFTVSPIRHWKDGAIENMRSKASLLLAINELQNLFPNVYYFPVYEVFMDELRDYRFYAKDMLHPTEFAVEYVWQIFRKVFIDRDTLDIYNHVEKLLKSFTHRALNKNTDAYKKFKSSLIVKATNLQKQYPFLSFEDELKQL